MAGAVVAGTLWQLAQLAYVGFVISLVQRSKVYGTLWQLPILLAWNYVAWTIILFGAEVSRAHHEVAELRASRNRPEPPSQAEEMDEWSLAEDQP
jgi:membrane protein